MEKRKEILERKRKFVIANQLLKSGTSIGQIFLSLKVRKAERIYSSIKNCA